MDHSLDLVILHLIKKKKTTDKIDYSNLMLRGIANSDEIRKLSPLPETEEEL